MRRAYLLVYSTLAGSKSQMKAWLSEMQEVVTWRTDLPNSFYVISDKTASELSAALRARTGPKGRFLISEVSPNRNGWLPPDTWYLLTHKAHRPKRP